MNYRRLSLLSAIFDGFVLWSLVSCGTRVPARISLPTVTETALAPTNENATIAAAATDINAQGILTAQAVGKAAAATGTAQASYAAPTSTLVAPTATPILSKLKLRTEIFKSLDGKWIATVTVALPATEEQGAAEMYYTQLKVAQADGAIAWTPVDGWSNWGLGYTTPRSFHWSKDGSRLFFTNVPVPDGCALFVNGSDLWSLDLSDGRVQAIVPAVGLSLSLSPDETMLAYIGWGDRGLVLRDLQTGAERELKVNQGQAEVQAGDIVWSPDGTSIMLTAAVHPCAANNEATSIVRVDIPTLTQTTLIREDKRRFNTVEWSSPDIVSLQDGDGQLWQMDPKTGQVAKQ